MPDKYNFLFINTKPLLHIDTFDEMDESLIFKQNNATKVGCGFSQCFGLSEQFVCL